MDRSPHVACWHLEDDLSAILVIPLFSHGFESVALDERSRRVVVGTNACTDYLDLWVGVSHGEQRFKRLPRVTLAPLHGVDSVADFDHPDLIGPAMETGQSDGGFVIVNDYKARHPGSIRGTVSYLLTPHAPQTSALLAHQVCRQF